MFHWIFQLHRITAGPEADVIEPVLVVLGVGLLTYGLRRERTAGRDARPGDGPPKTTPPDHGATERHSRAEIGQAAEHERNGLVDRLERCIEHVEASLRNAAAS